MPDISRRRLALFVCFFIPGMALASWVTRTPAIRDAISASLTEMGFVLLALSLGSISSLALAGVLIGRWGTRPIVLAGTWTLLAGVVVVASGAFAASMLLVALGLGIFGLGIGLGEVALNVDGADEERVAGHPLMHMLHGCFSLGTVCGALFGFACAWAGVPVAWHLAIVSAAAGAAILSVMRHLPAGIGLSQGHTAEVPMPSVHDPYWRDRAMHLIAIVVLAVALAEGAANDWLPILMVDEHGFSAASGSLIYLGFAVAMTFGRFAGGRVLDRFGPVAVLRGSAVLCAGGLALVIFSPMPGLAAVSVLLWGLGASLGFPIAISAAGASGPNATGRVQAITISGYGAFLIGPPLLGLIGEHYGLRAAMLIVFMLIVIAGLAAGGARPRDTFQGR